MAQCVAEQMDFGRKAGFGPAHGVGELTAVRPGGVLVYHGSLTPLPRRYNSRQRLCLRGTTDCWVNGLDGTPFFVVTEPVNAGSLPRCAVKLSRRCVASCLRRSARRVPSCHRKGCLYQARSRTIESGLLVSSSKKTGSRSINGSLDW